jgi:hypothetical protein
VPRRSLWFALALALGGLLFAAAPASATYCPAGTDYVTDYCVNSALFQTIVLDDFPEAYYRLDDPLGSETMTDFSGHGHHGEYKNGQDSGPIGVTAADNDVARDFFGSGGYGYVNGIQAPGQDTGYSNYTMEIWFNQKDTDGNTAIHDDAMLMQLGGGGALYIKNNTIRFSNKNDEVISPATFNDGEWWMVVGRKTANHLELWTRKSPGVATFFNPTPDATGTSSYRPGGTPTFYIGYGEYAPWFNGSLDEAVYYRHAVPAFRLGYHFYADPAPDNLSNSPRPHKAGASKGDPSKGGSANSKSKSSKKAKLARAKASVKRLKKLVSKAQVWLASLKHHHKSAKAIKKARAQLKKLNRQLVAARHKVKQLS